MVEVSDEILCFAISFDRQFMCNLSLRWCCTPKAMFCAEKAAFWHCLSGFCTHSHHRQRGAAIARNRMNAAEAAEGEQTTKNVLRAFLSCTRDLDLIRRAGRVCERRAARLLYDDWRLRSLIRSRAHSIAHSPARSLARPPARSNTSSNARSLAISRRPSAVGSSSSARRCRLYSITRARARL